MDSLLIVLVVIGVIMILAGVARMRSKTQRRRSWDDIDHSVLFSKAGPGREGAADEPPSAPHPVANSAADAHDLEGESPPPRTVDAPLVDEDAGAEPFRIKVDADDARAHERKTAAAPVTKRVRSVLGKLRGNHQEAESPAAQAPPEKKGHKHEAPDKVIILNVMAPPGQHFIGPALIEMIERSGLRYGPDMQIFQYIENDAPLFGLVNMVKPGVFDLDDLEQLSTPGVSLFIQMPNDTASGLAAFDTMLIVAQQLAQKLGGELRDETRSVLTHSAVDHIRQQIAEYDCKWLASA
ncbi:hypothetical protein Tel_10235 [Candidatus Tenderia electrophaga]|mgnify:CR=1 FL=1|jgi:cell division protein ZipA|uniref:Cell division protein ZipA n=1 Tax=Candidatus Tenderia electrophaga TaxID=1748243 RepID=A0A0S2TEC7_9GAMM|nr:hypothetical protein Tel_10235 [Candidatus Tenderia electrophaga]